MPRPRGMPRGERDVDPRAVVARRGAPCVTITLSTVVATIALGYVAAASAFMTGAPIGAAPQLRASRAGVTSICMGRKGAQTGLGGGNTRTVTREKKGGGVAIIKVKRTKDDVSRASILKALESASKDNFAATILNADTEKFMKEEAGSSLYPRLMRKIKFTAKKVGATVPEGWCYEAAATKKFRDRLAEKAAEAAAAAAEAEAAGAEEGEGEGEGEAPAAE